MLTHECQVYHSNVYHKLTWVYMFHPHCADEEMEGALRIWLPLQTPIAKSSWNVKTKAEAWKFFKGIERTNIKEGIKANKVPFFLVQMALRKDCLHKEILATVCWMPVIMCGNVRWPGISVAVTSDDEMTSHVEIWDDWCHRVKMQGSWVS